jgi:Kef-type K+ transport system membrane component KefB
MLLLGFVADGLGKRTRLPRVTLLLVLGVLIGPSVFGLLPDLDQPLFAASTQMALVMVGFLLGGELTLGSLRERGRVVLFVSLSVVAVTSTVELLGLAALGLPLTTALVLAGIAPATAPAATTDVVHEAGSRGPFVDTLLSVVAIDDAWGLLLFSVVVALAEGLVGEAALASLALGAWEIGGAVLLGAVLGVPMAYLTGRVQPGEPTLVEALGLVLVCGGLALWLEVSLLLAAMTMGAVVANLAKHHERPFRAIENVDWPFLVLFFVVSGASLRIDSLGEVGLAAAAYIVLRIVGRLVGAWAGATLGGAEPAVKKWMGLALMPQAGVALGMALVATQHFPELAETVLPIVVLSTVVFELVGPICTKRAILRAESESER